jgi:hypothetical protein
MPSSFPRSFSGRFQFYRENQAPAEGHWAHQLRRLPLAHDGPPHLSAAGFDEYIWLRFAILTLASICVAELSSIDLERPLIAWGSVFPSRKLCLKSYATGLSSFCQAAGIERPFR